MNAHPASARSAGTGSRPALPGVLALLIAAGAAALLWPAPRAAAQIAPSFIKGDCAPWNNVCGGAPFPLTGEDCDDVRGPVMGTPRSSGGPLRYSLGRLHPIPCEVGTLTSVSTGLPNPSDLSHRIPAAGTFPSLRDGGVSWVIHVPRDESRG